MGGHPVENAASLTRALCPVPAFGNSRPQSKPRRVLTHVGQPLHLDEDLVDRHFWRAGELDGEAGHRRLELGTVPEVLV